MSTFQTLDNIPLSGKTVLLRADLNVPMKEGRVSDDTRLVRLQATLKDLTAGGARVVILSHFGRPDGKRDEKYSLRPVAATLGDILKMPVAFAEDCIGPVAQKAVEALKSGEILVLENTRFHAGEEANDPAFAKEIALLGDIFVNDAFSAAHRAHATTTGLASLMPSAAGRLMQEELGALAKALERPERPLAALIGGSKISTKLDLLQNLVSKVDFIVLGGGMANTFMAAKGIAVGKSLYEPDMLDTSRAIMAAADAKGCAILLPCDVVVATELKEDAPHEIVAANAIPECSMIFDIGPKTIAEIKDSLAQCKTVIWNGPLGVFETPPFDNGTNQVAICVADMTKRGQLLSVAGGGDTVAAMANAGTTFGLSYLSTAGGAFLEWLEGKELPGVVALEKAVPAVKKGKVII